MLNQIRKTIATHSMLERGDRLVVAVSGGPDSVALLHILSLLSNEFGLHLVAAHLNHGLRPGEADEEEEFVRRLSDGMGIVCVCKRVDARELRIGRKGSLEEICREERYRFLDETAGRCGAVKIAVGHHRDDQAETVLIHLLRGAGPEGLRGILPVRDGRIIRPLLEVGRADILQYIEQEGLACRFDSSNRSPVFLRNRLRNELIPRLAAEYNPRLAEGLGQTAAILRREDDYLNGVVRQTLRSWGIEPGSEGVVVPVAEFVALHEALQGRIIKSLLEEAAPLRNGIGFRHVEAVLLLARRQDVQRASLDLPFRIRVERAGGLIRIGRERERKARNRVRANPPRFEYPVEAPAEVHLREIGRTVHLTRIEKPGIREMKGCPEIGFMDYDRVIPPLVLRSMRPGDRFAPLGTGGTKKLKEYFIDRKVAAACRGSIPLLADAGSIIWIAGERISERVRVTDETKNVLRAELIISGKPSEII